MDEFIESAFAGATEWSEAMNTGEALSQRVQPAEDAGLGCETVNLCDRFKDRLPKILNRLIFFSMKTLVAKEEQFLTDAKGKRTGVLLTLDTYKRLREAAEELADIQAYDALHDRAHKEIAAGQFETLTSYRSSRKRRTK